MSRTDRLPAKVLIFLALLVPGAGRAGDSSPWNDSEACEADVEKLCSKVQPGGARIVACLESHEVDLSQDCKEQLTAAKEKAEAVKKACKADAEKLCKKVTPGKGRVLACLRAHQVELSADCKEELAD
jgi:hypothetical protein